MSVRRIFALYDVLHELDHRQADEARIDIHTRDGPRQRRLVNVRLRRQDRGISERGRRDELPRRMETGDHPRRIRRRFILGRGVRGAFRQPARFDDRGGYFYGCVVHLLTVFAEPYLGIYLLGLYFGHVGLYVVGLVRIQSAAAVCDVVLRRVYWLVRDHGYLG